MKLATQLKGRLVSRKTIAKIMARKRFYGTIKNLSYRAHNFHQKLFPKQNLKITTIGIGIGKTIQNDQGIDIVNLSITIYICDSR